MARRVGTDKPVMKKLRARIATFIDDLHVKQWTRIERVASALGQRARRRYFSQNSACAYIRCMVDGVWNMAIPR